MLPCSPDLPTATALRPVGGAAKTAQAAATSPVQGRRSPIPEARLARRTRDHAIELAPSNLFSTAL